MEQDWTTVTIRKTKPKTQIVHKNTNPEAQHLRKLEDDTVYVKPKKLSNESRNAIVKYRIDNKLSQSDLDSKCGFPIHTIQMFESNKLTPSIGQLQRLNKIMKTGLTLTN